MWCDPRKQVKLIDIGGFRHPVMDIHASFYLEVCGDLAQTGHTYLASRGVGQCQFYCSNSPCVTPPFGVSYLLHEVVSGCNLHISVVYVLFEAQGFVQGDT